MREANVNVTSEVSVNTEETFKRFTFYTIVNSDGKFSDSRSLVRIGKEYCYISYASVMDGVICYTNPTRAEGALAKLNEINTYGNLGHSFTLVKMISEQSSRYLKYVIKDSNGKFYDEFSSFQGITENYKKCSRTFGSAQLAKQVLDKLQPYFSEILYIEQVDYRDILIHESVKVGEVH